MKVLVSAFACDPARGSEPLVGWQWARQAARFHDVWVLTDERFRPSIEAELAARPMPTLRFIYHRLPGRTRFFRLGLLGEYTYGVLWQLTAIPIVRRWHQRVHFDVAHHVTIVSFQYPSCLAWLPCPFIWGPVGGCLRAPLVFYPTFGFRAALQELARDTFNVMVRYSPLVLWTMWRADRIVPTTEFSQRVLPRWAVSKTVLMRGEGVELGSEPPPRPKRIRGVRFLYVGRLVHWKGVHLAIRAFADYLKTDPDGQFTIQMDGPYRPRLQRLAAQLGISDRVVFDLTSTIADVQRIYDTHDVFICPSLHDSGSFVTLEAMSRGLPVVCFDRGGPAHSVTDAVGMRIATHSPAQAIADMAAALRRLGSDPELRAQMGCAGRHRAATHFNWDGKGTFMRDLYPAVQGESRPDWPINAESHA